LIRQEVAIRHFFSLLPSKDKGRLLRASAGDGAEGDGAALAGLADLIDAEVGFGVILQLGGALGGELGKLSAGDAALIDRLLNALAEAEQDMAHAQADLVVGDIVGNEIEHSILQSSVDWRSPGKEGADAEGLPFHSADCRHDARLALGGVDVLPLKDAVDGEDEDAAAVVGEAAGAGIGFRAVEEVLGADLAAVDEADDETVDLMAELLDEVGGQGEVAGLEGVEQADLGQQAGGPESGGRVDIEQGIAEGEQCVNGIGRGAALAAEERPVAGEAEELVLDAVKERAAGGAFETE
jgi:hypothetical protein